MTKGKPRAPTCGSSLRRLWGAALATCFLAHSAPATGTEASPQPLSSNSVFRSVRVISKAGRLWEIEQLQPPSLVKAVAQDARGYLWLATRGDLLRSDGAQLVSFAEPLRRTLGSSDVSAVIGGPDDTVTIALTSGQIGIVHADGSITGRTWLAGRPESRFARTEDGSSVIASATAIYRIAATTMSKVEVPATIRLWTSDDHHVFAETPNALWSDTSVMQPLPGQQSGRHAVLLPTLHPRTLAGRGDLLKHLAERTLKASYTDAGGDVWLGLNQGLLWIHGDTIAMFSAEDGLPSSDVEAIAGDREGGVWVTTYGGGLCRLGRANLRTVGFRDGMGGEVPFAFAHAPEGGLAITTTAGLSVLDAEGFRNFGTRNGLPTHSVRSAQNYPNGDVLMTTLDNRLVRFHVNDGTFSMFAVPSSGKHASAVSALSGLANGDFVIGLNNGQLLSMRASSFIELRPAACSGDTASACAEAVRAIAEYEGALWLGTENAGLIRFSNNTANALPLLSTGHIETLFNDGQGGLWIALGGDNPRLYLRKAGRLRRLPFSENVKAMVADDGGVVWAGTDNGIFRLSPSPGDGGLAQRRFGIADGLASEEVIGTFAPSAFKSADGHLWFATLGGLVQIDPKAVARTAAAPRPVIESLETDQRSFAVSPATKELSVGPGSGTVRMTFTAPTLANRQQVKLRYRLLPLESQWQAASGTRTASYMQLPPGRYTFAVQTLADLNEPATVTFSVLPHIYQTLWFRLCVVTLFLALCFAAYRFRIGQAQQRQALIQAERSRVARDLHDTLAQVFAAIGLQVDRILARTSGVDAQSELSQVRQMITHARIAARGAILGMRGGVIRELGQAMQELKDSFAPFSVVIYTEGDTVRAAPTVETEICFIVQEAIANAIEHGHASHATIEIETQQSVVTVRVRDNGQGFAEDKTPEPTAGMGMRVMRERARLLKGTLRMHSEKGVGTEVELELPRQPHFS